MTGQLWDSFLSSKSDQLDTFIITVLQEIECYTELCYIENPLYIISNLSYRQVSKISRTLVGN